MNFPINRIEIIAVTGIKRTQTFTLQKTGEIKALTESCGKSWFDLAQVLSAAAVLRGQPLPDEQCVQELAQMVLEARLKKMV